MLDEFCHGRKRRDGSRIDGGTGLSPNAHVYRLHLKRQTLTPDQGKKLMERKKHPLRRRRGAFLPKSENQKTQDRGTVNRRRERWCGGQ